MNTDTPKLSEIVNPSKVPPAITTIRDIPHEIGKWNGVVGGLLALLKLQREKPKVSSEELQNLPRFKKLSDKAVVLLDELDKAPGQRDDTKIVILQEFFDIPKSVWSLLEWKE